MNIINIFSSWYYIDSTSYDVSSIIKKIALEKFSINVTDITKQTIPQEQSILLRNSSLFLQAVKITQPSKLILYDPRWIQIVAKNQLPLEHQIITTPTRVFFPGYIWWQTTSMIEVDWYQGHPPMVDF
jgi:hypothetical protein